MSFHGGGFAFGNLDAHNSIRHCLAAPHRRRVDGSSSRAGAALSGPVEDCYSAFAGLARQVARL